MTNDSLDARCRARVWKKDTYRRTGRTKSGFEMHYNPVRCSRRATNGDRCWQHSADNGFMDYES
jgi:hypothetical protein